MLTMRWATESEESGYCRWPSPLILKELHSNGCCELGPSESEICLSQIPSGIEITFKHTGHQIHPTSGTIQPNSYHDMRVSRLSGGLDLLWQLYYACAQKYCSEGVPSRACGLLDLYMHRTIRLRPLLPERTFDHYDKHSPRWSERRGTTRTIGHITLGSMNTAGTVTLCDIAALI